MRYTNGGELFWFLFDEELIVGQNLNVESRMVQADDPVADTQAPSRSPAKRPTRPIPNALDVMEGPVTTTQTTPVVDTKAPTRSPPKRPTQPEEILNVINVMEAPVTDRDPFAATTQATDVAAQPEGFATDVQSVAPLVTSIPRPTAPPPTTATTTAAAVADATRPTNTTEIHEFYPVGR